MMEEKKDTQLQDAFEEYFDGTQAPNIDLARARAELEGARRRRQRGKRISAVLSACAAFALVLALTFTVLPTFLARSNAGDKSDADMSQAPTSPDNSTGLSPAPGDDGDVAEVHNPVYSLFAITEQEMSYKELRGTFSSYMKDFETVEADGTVVCRYSLYTYDGVAVMVGAQISATGDVPFTATVYADLSGGRYRAEELAGYDRLPQENGYRIFTEQKGGEYLSKIYWEKNGEKFAQVSASSAQGAQVLMSYFL